jgi:hypothetical protein
MARSSQAVSPEPLGSLTQPGARTGATCRMCNSERVTRISMELTDGSPVDFTSCLDCEHRTWEQGEDLLSVDRVLTKAQRHR